MRPNAGKSHSEGQMSMRGEAESHTECPKGPYGLKLFETSKQRVGGNTQHQHQHCFTHACVQTPSSQADTCLSNELVSPFPLSKRLIMFLVCDRLKFGK